MIVFFYLVWLFADEQVQAVDEEYSMESQEDDTELSSFSLTKISKSTNDFANDNKLGEGGFGPVYKVSTLTLCLLTYYLKNNRECLLNNTL